MASMAPDSSLARPSSRDCSGLARRDFIRAGVLGLGSLSLAHLLAAKAAGAAAGKSYVRDRSIVLLFLAPAPGRTTTLLGIAPILGLDPGLGEPARATGPFSAIWYVVFALPLFLFTPDEPPRPVPGLSRAAFADRGGTPDPKPFLDVAMPWLYERLGVRG